MKGKYIGVLLALTLALSGCGRSADRNADQLFAGWNDQIHTEMSGDAEQWSYTLSVQSYPISHRTAEGRLLVQGSYELPVMQALHADGTPFDERLEASAPAVLVAQRFNDAFAQRLSTWQVNYSELCTLAEADYENGGASWSNEEYYYTDNVEAAFWNNGHIACVTLRSESFTGGAHSIRSRTSVTFDMHTGQEITINDMVDDYAGLRDAVALEILSQIEGGRYVDNYNGKMLFDDYQETIPEWMTRAIFFGEENMTVVFGAYDIAAYAAGEQAFAIPYSLIEPYLNDYGGRMLELK